MFNVLRDSIVMKEAFSLQDSVQKDIIVQPVLLHNFSSLVQQALMLIFLVLRPQLNVSLAILEITVL